MNDRLMRLMSKSKIGKLSELAGAASTEAVAVAAEVLADDIANTRWRAQIGPCLTQAATASLLGITPQGVVKRSAMLELLRVTNGDGRPVYPLFQFVGRRTLDGLGPVLRTLVRVDDDLTMASWLTTKKSLLDGSTPVEALRAGNAAGVLAAAEDYLARSA